MEKIRFNAAQQYPTIFMGNYFMPDGGKPIHTYLKCPIEWLVLKVDSQNKKALLLSKYVLDWEGYADCPLIGSGYNTYWAISYLRKWLNDEFLNSCFNAKEQSIILSVYTSLGKANEKRTIDRIFLLSTEEVKEYFKTPEEAKTYEPMVFNPIDSEQFEISYEPCFWWTRTQGSKPYMVECVNHNGYMTEQDSNANENGVRPAMWIKLL